MNKEKCNSFINKWLICNHFNKIPYEKTNETPIDCDQYYTKYLKECTGGEKYKVDNIFKASVFATH